MQECGIYFASITAVNAHYQALHSSRRTKSVDRKNENATTNVRRSQRIAAKIMKRDQEALCQTFHSSTGAENIEWLEEDEVPEGVPNEALSALDSYELSVISN